MPLFTDTLDYIDPAGDMIRIVQAGALLRRVVVVDSNNEIPVGAKYHIEVSLAPAGDDDDIEYFILVEERFDGDIIVIEHGEDYTAIPSRRIPGEGLYFEAEASDAGGINAVLLLVGGTDLRRCAHPLERDQQIDQGRLLALLDTLGLGPAYRTYYAVV